MGIWETEIMKIAILSDTHGLLRPEVIGIIKDSDAVIHGGDIDSQKVLDDIKRIMKRDASIFAVRGNNDKEWARKLPVSLQFELMGIRFFLIHNKKEIPENVNADIIISGHSHRYCEESINGCKSLNPGSCGKRRFNLPVTMAVLNIDSKGYSIEKIEIASCS